MTDDQILLHELGISIDDEYAQQLEAAFRVIPPSSVEEALQEAIRCLQNDWSEQLHRANKLAAENAELRQSQTALELGLIMCILAAILLVGIVAALHNPSVHAFVLSLAGIHPG